MADETARTGGLDRERADGSHLKKSGVHFTRTATRSLCDIGHHDVRWWWWHGAAVRKHIIPRFAHRSRTARGNSVCDTSRVDELGCDRRVKDVIRPPLTPATRAVLLHAYDGCCIGPRHAHRTPRGGCSSPRDLQSSLGATLLMLL